MPNNVFMKALFRTPKYNVFPQENEVKLSYEAGKEIPVQYWDLVPGDSIKSHLSELTRMAALLSPVFQRYKIDFHAIAVPHRLCIPMSTTYDGYFDGFESFHNLSVAENKRPKMPQTTMHEYVAYLYKVGLNPIGTLFDYLQYPTFADWYRRWLAVEKLQGYASLDASGYQASGTTFIAKTYTKFRIRYDESTTHDYTCPRFGSLLGFLAYIYASTAPAVTTAELKFDKASFDAYQNYMASSSHDITINPDVISKYIENTGLKVTQIVDKWIGWMYTRFYLFGVDGIQYHFENNQQPISLLPIYAYWSVIYDWYINTNLEQNAEDKSTWLHEVIKLNFDLQYSYGLVDEGFNEYSYLIVPPPTEEADATPLPVSVFLPFDSYWSNDYFTSAFLAPQSGSAVSIPANGTIADLRNANSLQEFMEKLIYSGKRAIDVVKTIFGVESSDSRLDRTQVIGSKHFNINFMEISQTSQSDIDSSLADYAGQGISVGKDSFIDFTAEEHTLVMVFMRVRPNAIYESQVNHLLFQTDPYDFLIPDFAQVGEQPILVDEIYPQDEQGKVFGYTRRYAQYMFTPSHVHGEFLTSLDYWHSSRRFDSEPVLNTEFAKVTEKDDLNRIFAVPGAKEHFYSYLHFDTLISRPLGKYVEYSL